MAAGGRSRFSRSERGGALFPGPDADDAGNRRNDDLAVADLAGGGRLDDGSDDGVHVGVVGHELELEAGGEVERASALIHTLRFGNHYRAAVGAKSHLAFCNTRGGPGAPITIPLMDKADEGRRSHYLTIQLSIPDAPGPDEIAVALGASLGGRPHHRIGDRYQDLAEMGRDSSNPAAV